MGNYGGGSRGTSVKPKNEVERRSPQPAFDVGDAAKEVVARIKACRQRNAQGDLQLAFDLFHNHLASSSPPSGARPSPCGGKPAHHLHHQEEHAAQQQQQQQQQQTQQGQTAVVRQAMSELMRMCLAAKQPHRAVALLDDIDRLQLPLLDNLTFSLLARAASMSDDAMAAKRLLGKMQQTSGGGATVVGSFKPNAMDCSQLILTLCKMASPPPPPHQHQHQKQKQGQGQGQEGQGHTFVKLEEVEAVVSVMMDQWQLSPTVMVHNKLINLYSKHGQLEKARRQFDQMTERDVVSWTAMLAAYTQHGHGKEALRLFKEMKAQGIRPDNVTFVSALTACANVGDLEEGKALHAELLNTIKPDIVVYTALLNMYAKCGSLADARHVFDTIKQRRNLQSWNTMLAAYAQHGHGKEALQLFKEMKAQGIRPDNVTFVSALTACANVGDLEEGKALHAELLSNSIKPDVILYTALLNMYAKCGSLTDARHVFDTMKQRNLQSWTAMLAAYAQHGHGKEALQLFKEMKAQGIRPNNVTFVSVLTACANVGDLEEGKALHAELLNDNTITPDLIVQSTLLNMYAKCGSLTDVCRIFDGMPQHDVVSWSTLIGAHVQHGLGEKALMLFKRMKEQGVTPNEVTFISALQACGSVQALQQGRQLHKEIMERGGMLSNGVVANMVMDMYGRCGRVGDAWEVFDKMEEHSRVSWNVLLRAYGQVGKGREVLKLLEEMQRRGFVPDEITWTTVLSSCSHGGLVDEGVAVFEKLLQSEGAIKPTEEMYNCMVDLFARVGRLDEAEKLMREMPMGAGEVTWMTLLGACRLHKVFTPTKQTLCACLFVCLF